MKASSESGECASLISIGCFSARGAGWVAGIAWLRPFSFGDERPSGSVAVPGGRYAPCGADQGRCGREPLAIAGTYAPGAGAFSLAERNILMVRQQIP